MNLYILNPLTSTLQRTTLVEVLTLNLILTSNLTRFFIHPLLSKEWQAMQTAQEQWHILVNSTQMVSLHLRSYRLGKEILIILLGDCTGRMMRGELWIDLPMRELWPPREGRWRVVLGASHDTRTPSPFPFHSVSYIVLCPGSPHLHYIEYHSTGLSPHKPHLRNLFLTGLPSTKN